MDNNDGGDREMQDGWRVVRDGPGVMESTDGILRDGAPLLDRYLCPPPWAPSTQCPPFWKQDLIQDVICPIGQWLTREDGGTDKLQDWSEIGLGQQPPLIQTSNHHHQPASLDSFWCDKSFAS